MYKVAFINGKYRLVWDEHYEWVKRKGLANKPACKAEFDTYEEACAYMEKFDELRGQF